MYFSSVRGVREEHSSGSGLSESRCSFLFRALTSPQRRSSRRRSRTDRSRRGAREVEEERERGRRIERGGEER